ncbi:hypothetical protein EBU99_13430 [bacterium]|nr:hypothetical protein [bacterium]
MLFSNLRSIVTAGNPRGTFSYRAIFLRPIILNPNDCKQALSPQRLWPSHGDFFETVASPLPKALTPEIRNAGAGSYGSLG